MLNSTNPADPRSARAVFPASSKTLEANDRRIVDLAKAMLRLNAEGGCTRALLLQEGFSEHELDLHGQAARALADKGFVRQIAEEAANAQFETDEQLLDRAVRRVGGLLDVGQIVATLRADGFTPITLARLWPRLWTLVGKGIGTTPMPKAA